MKHTPVLALLVLVGCSTPRDTLPDIAAIYSEAALHEARNPVVVIHGILGARLADAQKPDRTVWGAFTNDYADPSTREGARAVALQIDGTPEDAVASGPLETLKLSLLFNVLSVDVYRNIIRTLGAGGYMDGLLVDRNSPRYAMDHFTCHSFFYDWRKDNVENAIALGEYLKTARVDIVNRARGKIRELRKDPSPAHLKEATELEDWLAGGFKFDIVAHSMGGLVARYFLRYGAEALPIDGSEPTVTWAGAREIDRLIIVGTPNLGSMEALSQLTEGFQPAIILPFYDQAVLGTMPSIYQLLPRTRHNLVLDESGQPMDVDFMDVEVWDRNNWGILDPVAAKTLGWLLPDAETRREKAREHLASCLARAKEFHRALDKKPEGVCSAHIYLFAADSQPTLGRTVLKKEGNRLIPTFPRDESTVVFGDATVPRYSAVGDEREGSPYKFGQQTNIPYRNETFFSDDHIGLTMNSHFANNMLHILLERPAHR